ncbi:MAG: hypothetical protein LPJ87_01525, partial [Zoogloeaceae bacterium]|nr:hypothetical protein [Zoogloeaceae bacterium]
MARTPRSTRSAVPIRSLSCALALAFATPAALAQESEARLQDVVVTATGFEQKITDAPASISVVT